MTMKDLCKRYNELSNLYVGYKVLGMDEMAQDVEARRREIYHLLCTYFTNVPKLECEIRNGVVTFYLQ